MKALIAAMAFLSVSANAEYMYPVQPGIATVQQEPVMGGTASVITVPILDRTPPEQFDNEYNWNARSRTVFRYVEVEKMPCVMATQTGYQERSIALTCDWSKWQGETFEQKLKARK